MPPKCKENIHTNVCPSFLTKEYYFTTFHMKMHIHVTATQHKYQKHGVMVIPWSIWTLMTRNFARARPQVNIWSVLC